MNEKTFKAAGKVAFIVFPFVMFLAACSDQQKLAHDLQAYQQRMASVLSRPSQDLQKPTLPPYPSIKTLEQDIPPTTLKLAEFYAIQGCQLSTLVAQRNTTLGRIQYPSARYIYEVELLKEIEHCLTNSVNKEISSTLINLQQQKQKNLAMAWANLVQTSDEMKVALSTNSGFILGTEKDGINQTVQALEHLLRLLEHPEAKSGDVEQHLANLNHYQLPAKMWRSQILLTDNLRRITQWLEHNSSLMECPAAKASQKVEYLHNVFQLFFIEKIQPVATKINQYQYQLTPVMEALASNGHIHAQIKNMLMMHTQQNFKNYQMSIQEHIQFWQKLYKNCGIRPND